MSFTVDDVVKEARTWIGTPFAHQGRTKGRACDCLGLMIGVAKAVGYTPQDYDERRYGPFPISGNMGAGIEVYCDKLTVEHRIPGDWLWIAYGRDPTHLALITNVGTIIHAQPAMGKAGSRVVEMRLTNVYIGLARYVFRFRGMKYG